MEKKIKKYEDFQKAIGNVLTDMFGEARDVDIAEIVNRTLIRGEWVYDTLNLKIMDCYLNPENGACLYIVADDHFGDSY